MSDSKNLPAMKVYGNLPGVTKKSTSKLFKNAANGDIDEMIKVLKQEIVWQKQKPIESY